MRPCHGDDARYASDPYWRELVLFHEYFHAEDGRGVGASHQTGWTALAALLVEELAKNGNGSGLLETRFTRRPNLGGKRR